MAKHQVIRFSTFQTAKVVGVMYFVLGLCFLPFFIISLLGGQKPLMGPSQFIFFGMPVIYGFFGFVFTILFCFIYNFLAKRIGGIEVELIGKKGK